MIPWAKPAFLGREKQYVAEALDSTWISGGPFVERFESEFTAHHASAHGLAVSNGTTALYVAMLGLGIKLGDEVIVPSFGFMAPANMAITVGARPVFADVDPDTWCISPAAVERLITKRTRAIVATHTYGNVCDVDALRAIATQYGLYLIEDVAEAAFSRWGGKLAGTFGHVGCFSFQATKTITTGEGGFVVTDDAGLHQRMRLIHSHGMLPGKRYWHEVVGHNFRLTNLQAAVGCAQLEQLDEILAQRHRVHAMYLDRLVGLDGVTLQGFAHAVEPVVWAVAVKIDQTAFKFDRDGIIAELLAAGIETRPGFYAASKMPLYRWFEHDIQRVSEDVAANVICLPSFPDLTDDEINRVCDELERARR